MFKHSRDYHSVVTFFSASSASSAFQKKRRNAENAEAAEKQPLYETVSLFADVLRRDLSGVNAARGWSDTHRILKAHQGDEVIVNRIQMVLLRAG